MWWPSPATSRERGACLPLLVAGSLAPPGLTWRCQHPQWFNPHVPMAHTSNSQEAFRVGSLLSCVFLEAQRASWKQKCPNRRENWLIFTYFHHHMFQEPPTSKLQLSSLFTSLKPLNQCAPVSKHDEVSGTKWAHVRVGIYPCKGEPCCS